MLLTAIQPKPTLAVAAGARAIAFSQTPPQELLFLKENAFAA
jgi:hypothetical protein